MSEKPAKKATIIEVARQAGVSPATVGRVLGDYGYASSAIQERVRKAAEELGYRPNRLARGLITGKTQTIGVVAGDIESPFYASVLRGIGDVARGRGFGVIVTNSDESEQLEQEAVQLLLEKQVDGLIVSSTAIDAAQHLRDALASNCPVVQFDRVVRNIETDTVVLDNVAAARSCVAKLIEAGHRRIGIIAELGPSALTDVATVVADMAGAGLDLKHLYPSWQRLLGYLEAHRAAGVEPDLDLIRRVGTYSTAHARQQTLEVLALAEPPSALFTADGVMSTGAMEAITSLEIEIPRALSLVCFDDLDWMKFVRPGLTAVSQPAHQMGMEVAKMLLARIDGEAGPWQHLVLPAQLIERNSIARIKPQRAAGRRRGSRKGT